MEALPSASESVYFEALEAPFGVRDTVAKDTASPLEASSRDMVTFLVCAIAEMLRKMLTIQNTNFLIFLNFNLIWTTEPG